MRGMLLTLVLFCEVAEAAGRYDVFVQGAVDSELRPPLYALEGKKQVQIRAWTYWRIGRKSVLVSRTEVGPINAIASTMVDLEQFRPRAIVNQGTAGAHNPSLRLWDIVVSEKTTDYDAFKSVHGDQGRGVQLERWTPMPPGCESTAVT